MEVKTSYCSRIGFRQEQEGAPSLFGGWDGPRTAPAEGVCCCTVELALYLPNGSRIGLLAVGVNSQGAVVP